LEDAEEDDDFGSDEEIGKRGSKKKAAGVNEDEEFGQFNDD
jgi:hypothetical protein